MYDRRMEPIYQLDDWQSRLRVRLALRTRLRRLLGRQSGSA
jgi:hypothetical protein